jgi:transposase-like protein
MSLRFWRWTGQSRGSSKEKPVLGIKIPKDRLCINSKGRVCMAKPECVKCGSSYVSNNGGTTRYPKTIIGTTLPIQIQKYICNDCGHTFDTPIEQLIQRYARVTNEIQALAVKLYLDC